MLTFDSNGYLKPYKPIETDLTVFEQTFATNAVRKLIFEQYKLYLVDVQKILPDGGFFQWIDGSYITKKPMPFDIDLVTFVPFNIYNENVKKLQALKWKYDKIDGYFVRMFPAEHRLAFETTLQKHQWLDVYGTDRLERPKGFIQIKF